MQTSAGCGGSTRRSLHIKPSDARSIPRLIKCSVLICLSGAERVQLMRVLTAETFFPPPS